MVERIGKSGVLISRQQVHTFASYDSLIFVADYPNKKITFYRNWDYSATTISGRNQALVIAGLGGLATTKAVSKAIEEKKFENAAGIEFKVEYCEDE